MTKPRQRSAKDSTIYFDPRATWLKSSLVWTLVSLTASVSVGGCVLYFSFLDVSKALIQTTKDFNVRMDSIGENVREVRDELRMISSEFIRASVGEAWIEKQRLANRAKYPDLIWTDLPKR